MAWEVTRTVRVRLDVPDDRKSDLHATNTLFQHCANRTSEWAWRYPDDFFFDGDRFDFEPYVESVESARRVGAKLRDIFGEGITVYGSKQLQSIQKAVFIDE